MDPTISIRLAEQDDMNHLAVLFDLYRQFYECPQDLDAAKNWIQDNMTAQRSVIFVAASGTGVIGIHPALPGSMLGRSRGVLRTL